MTMVLPSPYDVVDIHNYSAAAVYVDEIDSVHRRIPHNLLRSTSSSSPFSSGPVSIPKSESDRVIFDEMADDHRPDNNLNQPSSSSMDPEAIRVDESWLRLRLGSDDQSSSTPERRRGGLVELDLLPETTNPSHHHQQRVFRSNTRPPGFFQQPEFRAPPRPVSLLQRMPAPDINWALMRPSNITMTGQHQQQLGGNYYMANPASMSLMPLGPNFFARPNYGATPMGFNAGGFDGVPSSTGMRIIRPPRRPHVGVWFMLKASQNQVREPFLPQIPKSYLRIKNGRMTVRLLMKYLVQKLGLESESEVEIRCRGQELQPNLTLQHIRDNIWCTMRDMPLTLLTDSPSSSTSAVAGDSHIMILHYTRPLLMSTTAAAASTTTSAPIFLLLADPNL